MTLTQYYTATTLDGYIADDHNSLQWLFDVTPGQGEPSDGDSGWGRFIDGVGALAMGSTTYEWVLDHEKLLESPEKWAELYDGKPTAVFTHRDLPVLEGSGIEFVSGDVTAVHQKLAEAAGGRNVWIVGGGDLVGQFHDAGLLDQVIVTIAPVTLGAGAPLLPRRIEGLRLVDVRPNGPMVTLTYDVPAGG